MLIAATTDNHLFDGTSVHKMYRMLRKIEKVGPRVFLVGGDMGEGFSQFAYGSKPVHELLTTIDLTLYVFGNHDLYHTKPIRPPEVMVNNMVKLMPADGNPLEKWWYDNETVYIVDDHAFVGSFGGCDFQHPDIPGGPKAVAPYEPNMRDCECIDMRDWINDVKALNHAFMTRLHKACDTEGVTNVVITLHVPCYPSHSKITLDDPLWPFYYNYTLGVAISETAAEHPDKKFWVLCGHAHDFCHGRWNMEGDNVYTHGMKANYQTQQWITFDTDHDIATLRQEQ